MGSLAVNDIYQESCGAKLRYYFLRNKLKASSLKMIG